MALGCKTQGILEFYVFGVYVSIYQPIYLSIDLSTCRSADLCLSLSTSSVDLSIYLSMALSTYLPVKRQVHELVRTIHLQRRREVVFLDVEVRNS